MNVKKETKKDFEGRIREFFIRGKKVKLSDHSNGFFLEWGKGGVAAIVVGPNNKTRSVTRASLVADNMKREGF